MKVLDLRCAHDHRFEGWFGSADDYASQRERGLVTCPVCGDAAVERVPSAPHLNVAHLRGAPSGATAAQASPASSAAAGQSAGASESTQASPGAAGGALAHPGANAGLPVPAAMQAQWMAAMREVLARTEDVGQRFPEEARRIHYGETEERLIRGQATPEERAELAEEGIQVHTLAVPESLKGPLQ